MNPSGNNTNNEILLKLEQSFLAQEKACKRLLELFENDKSFLLDSTGTNIDELENIQRKINLLIQKLIENINNELNNIVLKYDLNLPKQFIVLHISEDDKNYTIKINVESDGFLLEINE